MGRVLKTSLCIIMIVGVLCLSFSVYAAGEEEEEPITGVDRVQAQEYLMAYYIYEFLNSIGITVSYQGLIEYNDYVQDTIIDWVVRYIGDLIEAENVPSTYSISTWIAPWQADYDYWGNLKYNSTMLEDLEDFAEWLKSEFSLIDNNTQQIEPTYSVVNNIGDVSFSLYKTNKYYSAEAYPNINAVLEFNGNQAATAEYLQCVETTANDLYYFFWRDSESTAPAGMFMKCVYVSVQANPDIYLNQKIYNYSYDEVGYAEPQYVYLNSSHQYPNLYAYVGNPNHEYWYDRRNNVEHYYAFIPANCTYLYGTNEDLQNFLDIAEISIESMQIKTGDIELPSANPDYVSGDGVIIINGQPQYEQVTFSGEITNLPAIVSTQKIDNPGIGSLFNWIPTFINMASDSIDFFKQVVYMMPDQVLVCIFAVMGSGILFGLLRLMREH